MRLGMGYRGPKLGTKLVLFGLALLVIPWISYRQLYEMESLLLQGQTQTQLLTAEGIYLESDAGVLCKAYQLMKPLLALLKAHLEDWRPRVEKFYRLEPSIVILHF